MEQAESRPPYGGRTRTEYEALLRAKLKPENIRLTLAFASLYQLTHQMLKTVIVEKVREFYTFGFDERGPRLHRELYQREVLDPIKASAGKPNAFEGSVQWLVRQDAITPEEANRLRPIYLHRHDLTHELAIYLIDVDHNPDVELFQDAANILTKLHRFWIQLEIDSGGFFDMVTLDPLEDVDPAEVIPLSLQLLQQCVDAVGEGVD